jgi:helix-turn-helix protein
METTILTPHVAGDHGRQGLSPRQERHGDHELPGDHERHELSGEHGAHEDQEHQGDHGAPSGLSCAAAAAQETAENLNSAAAAPPEVHGDHEHQDCHGDHERQELSIPEAALAVGLSISTIRRLIQNGRLPARYERGDKGQNRYFIARADLAPLAALGMNPAVEAMGTPAERLNTHAFQAAPGPERMSTHGRQGDHSAAPMSRHGLPEGAAPLETMSTPLSRMNTQLPTAAGLEGDPGHHDDPAAAAAPAVGEGRDAGTAGAPPETLEHQAAYLELAVLRERLAGAQEAVRLHAERVRGQAKDIGFLQAQLDRSREAEEQLRVLLARLTAALPAPAEPPALAAQNLPPEPPARRVRWWQPWRRGG